MSNTYYVSGYLTISVFKEIQAKNEKEARKKAEELCAPGLCHQCAGAGSEDPGQWELNDFDDPPDDAVQCVERAKS
jgi:hypothetical protein